MKVLMFVVVALAVVLVGFISLYIQRYLFVCQVGDRMLRVRILGFITMHRIRWAEIAGVEIVPFFQTTGFSSRVPLLHERILGYEFSRRRVVIRLRRGIVRAVILSPKDPEKFVSEILSRVPKGGG